jgi:hypothetical protein
MAAVYVSVPSTGRAVQSISLVQIPNLYSRKNMRSRFGDLPSAAWRCWPTPLLVVLAAVASGSSCAGGGINQLYRTALAGEEGAIWSGIVHDHFRWRAFVVLGEGQRRIARFHIVHHEVAQVADRGAGVACRIFLQSNRPL